MKIQTNQLETNLKNIVFMGTPDFALDVLKEIYKEYNVIAVYTREAKPVGRKMVVTKSPVQTFAEENDIKVFTPKNFRDQETVEELKKLHPNIIIVAAYGIILPRDVLEIPSLGCINVHASLLPKLRGANPIQRSIMNGDRVTGITIMKMDKGMDTGNMLLKDLMVIDKNETYGELEKRLAKMGGKLILKYLKEMENILPQRQTSDFTLAPKLSKEESIIDWNKTADEIHNLVRALNPHPFANFTHGENIIKVIRTEVQKETTDKPAGTILNKNMDIACGSGTIIRILEVQKVGSKQMPIKDFLNGYKIEIGEVLGSQNRNDEVQA